MKTRTVVWLLAMTVMAASRMRADDDPAIGAKELFFDPQRQAAGDAVTPAPKAKPTFEGDRRVPAPDAGNQRLLGLSYWIELIDAAHPRGLEVTDDRTFHSGERIRLHFRGNADGRIMIIQLGSSGTSSVLFPDPDKGIVENALVANREQVLPTETHWFVFDAKPGTERLLVLFARSQQELNRSFPIQPTMDAPATEALLRLANRASGSKDLFIETETHQTSELGTYAVNVSGKPVVLQIQFRHR